MVIMKSFLIRSSKEIPKTGGRIYGKKNRKCELENFGLGFIKQIHTFPFYLWVNIK